MHTGHRVYQYAYQITVNAGMEPIQFTNDPNIIIIIRLFATYVNDMYLGSGVHLTMLFYCKISGTYKGICIVTYV